MKITPYTILIVLFLLVTRSVSAASCSFTLVQDCTIPPNGVDCMATISWDISTGPNPVITSSTDGWTQSTPTGTRQARLIVGDNTFTLYDDGTAPGKVACNPPIVINKTNVPPTPAPSNTPTPGPTATPGPGPTATPGPAATATPAPAGSTGVVAGTSTTRRRGTPTPTPRFAALANAGTGQSTNANGSTASAKKSTGEVLGTNTTGWRAALENGFYSIFPGAKNDPIERGLIGIIAILGGSAAAAFFAKSRTVTADTLRETIAKLKKTS
jgi:hypothetical protein